MNTDQKYKEMLIINKLQSEFYEQTIEIIESKGNLIKRVWNYLKKKQKEIRRGGGIDETVFNLHWKWLGNLSNKKVLDLGCFDGSELSLDIAERSDIYIGVDLSKSAIDRLNKKLYSKNLSRAKGISIDFLSDDFNENQFDVVYAKAVAHHFKYLAAFIERLSSIMKPGGIVVTIDPMQATFYMRLIRSIYQPFRSDRAWEWPLKKEAFSIIKEKFEIIALQGIMGSAKIAIPFAIINNKLATRICKKMHEKDKIQCKILGPKLYRCMQVTMCLKKPL